nr:MAG TPA: hypothetical protein [Caudoviricetes sp.]
MLKNFIDWKISSRASMVTVEEGSTTKCLQSQDSTRYLWYNIVRRNERFN